MKRLLSLALLVPMILTACTTLAGCDNDRGRHFDRDRPERLERRDGDRREHFERSHPHHDRDHNDWR
jgi:hypothetical protein